ncbi:unnamed protein product [Boreogadus saida]
MGFYDKQSDAFCSRSDLKRLTSKVLAHPSARRPPLVTASLPEGSARWRCEGPGVFQKWLLLLRNVPTRGKAERVGLGPPGDHPSADKVTYLPPTMVSGESFLLLHIGGWRHLPETATQQARGTEPAVPGEVVVGIVDSRSQIASVVSAERGTAGQAVKLR